MFLFSLFGIVFLNLLCVGANFPVLPAYNAEFGADNTAVALLYVAYGLSRAVVSPFWGQLSDRVGRKPIMTLGAMATIAGSVLWIGSDSWWMLLSSRLVDGIFSAQAVIAAAMITDAIKPEKRTMAYGLIGAGVSLGLTLGPIWGGLVSQHYSPAAVGYGFLILQGLSLLIVLFLLPETLPVSQRSQTTMSFLETVEPLRMKSVQPFFALTFFGSVIVGALTMAIPYRSQLVLTWTEVEVAYAFAGVGFMSALVQGGALRLLLKIARESTLVYSGLGLMVLGNLIPGLSYGMPTLVAGMLLTTIGGSIALPSVKGLLSQVPMNQAGSIMGYNQALQNLGRSLGPALGTLGIWVLPNGEFLLPAILTVVPFILVWRAAKNTPSPEPNVVTI